MFRRNKVRPPTVHPSPVRRWVLGDRDLAWTCHACTRERPDKLIEVFTRAVRFDDGTVMRVNVRHCADDQDCIDHAPSIAAEWTSRIEMAGGVADG